MLDVRQLKLSLYPVLALLSGCGILLNPLIGYERTFKNHIDGMIGENIVELKSKHIGTFHTEERRAKLENDLTEILFYRFGRDSWSGEFLNCRWVMIIDSKNTVTNWEYVSEPSQCHQPYLHEGPF